MDGRNQGTHPEASEDVGLEPTVDEQLRLAGLLKAIDDADVSQLRSLCRSLAHQALVVEPSVRRYLAREAARNLSGEPWRTERAERWAEELLRET